MTKKRIVGVIGLGHVGAHVAYSLAIQGIADELVLVDKNEQKLASEVQDLRDAAAYLPHRVTVRAGDFADLGECDVMVNSVAPVWDGNETWLVLGGAGLFGAFPLAYAVIVDALTIPLTLMLIGLIFRGVAFEFRFKATPAHRPFWDKAFLSGSILATFTQGVVVGAVLNGFSVTGRSYSGGPFDWLTPFTLFCGVGLVVAYALLGATWLVMKSENPLQDKMRSVAKKLLLALLVTRPTANNAPGPTPWQLQGKWLPQEQK